MTELIISSGDPNIMRLYKDYNFIQVQPPFWIESDVLDGVYNKYIPMVSGIETSQYFMDRWADRHCHSGFEFTKSSGYDRIEYAPSNYSHPSESELAGYPLHDREFWGMFKGNISLMGSGIGRQWDYFGWPNISYDTLWSGHNYSPFQNSAAWFPSEYSGSIRNHEDLLRFGKIDKPDYLRYIPRCTVGDFDVEQIGVIIDDKNAVQDHGLLPVTYENYTDSRDGKVFLGYSIPCENIRAYFSTVNNSFLKKFILTDSGCSPLAIDEDWISVDNISGAYYHSLGIDFNRKVSYFDGPIDRTSLYDFLFYGGESGVLESADHTIRLLRDLSYGRSPQTLCNYYTYKNSGTELSHKPYCGEYEGYVFDPAGGYGEQSVGCGYGQDWGYYDGVTFLNNRIKSAGRVRFKVPIFAIPLANIVKSGLYKFSLKRMTGISSDVPQFKYDIISNSNFAIVRGSGEYCTFSSPCDPPTTRYQEGYLSGPGGYASVLFGQNCSCGPNSYEFYYGNEPGWIDDVVVPNTLEIKYALCDTEEDVIQKYYDHKYGSIKLNNFTEIDISPSSVTYTGYPREFLDSTHFEFVGSGELNHVGFTGNLACTSENKAFLAFYFMHNSPSGELVDTYKTGEIHGQGPNQINYRVRYDYKRNPTTIVPGTPSFISCSGGFTDTGTRVSDYGRSLFCGVCVSGLKNSINGITSLDYYWNQRPTISPHNTIECQGFLDVGSLSYFSDSSEVFTSGNPYRSSFLMNGLQFKLDEPTYLYESGGLRRPKSYSHYRI